MQYDILVFSHLRWNSVTQRPQHIMRRLSNKYTILFVEEPDGLAAESDGRLFSLEEANNNLKIFTPHIEWDGWKTMCLHYASILAGATDAINDCIFWFYSPQYVHLLNSFKPSLVVYDCMDELSAFKDASPDLPLYETQLLEQADVVFTGGASLFEAKRILHENVYCFPSSVDAEHFKQAISPATLVPQDIAMVKRPIAGFYGVIDERIDYSLLKLLAEEMPDFSFVMIGPFAKIKADDCPRAPNIHYLGKKEYSSLPGYLKGMDLAIMPFILNGSTRFISPTKTLEFMAAGKPVVSTAIHDVERHYSGLVGIARDAVDFSVLLRTYVGETTAAKEDRMSRMQAAVENTSWQKTVNEMEDVLLKGERTMRKLHNW